jgi:hypothetical protein
MVGLPPWFAPLERASGIGRKLHGAAQFTRRSAATPSLPPSLHPAKTPGRLQPFAGSMID